MADERAPVLYCWMADYGADPSPQRPRRDACDRPLLAEPDRTLTSNRSPLAAFIPAVADAYRMGAGK